MKKIYFIITLLVLVSCSKNNDIDEEIVLNNETALYVAEINKLRMEHDPSLIELKLDDKLVVFSERCNDYYEKNNKFVGVPEMTAISNELGVKRVSTLNSRVLDYQNFDFIDFLKIEEFYIYNPAFTKIGFSIRKTCVFVCFN